MRKSSHSSKRKRKAAIKRRRNRNRHKELDRMSQLPNDILISIINRLTLREATATSILSTRWRFLHTYVNNLNFPPFERGSCSHSEINRKRFPNHVNMINRILDSHRGGRVKEFKVDMNYCRKGASIKKWVEFALDREAESINITMLPCSFSGRGHYLLRLSKLVWNKTALKCLKQLSLSVVGVSDQDFELLLSNFLALETLSIRYSNNLKFASVVAHPKLKHLDISHARKLESFEISDVMNLLSIRCHGFPLECTLQLRNLPKLIKFSSSEDTSQNPHSQLYAKIPSCIRDQLQMLHLSTSSHMHVPPVLPFGFANIKHLELEVIGMHEYALTVHSFSPLIEACRSLENLKIKFVWRLYETDFQKGKVFIFSPRQNSLSPNLKELAITGYLGCASELKLALYIIKNVVALEKLTVVACDLGDSVRRLALARARRDFRPITPPSANLIITTAKLATTYGLI